MESGKKWEEPRKILTNYVFKEKTNEEEKPITQKKSNVTPNVVFDPSFFTYDLALSFSNRYDNSTKQNYEKKKMEIFPQVQIYIPLM